MNPFLTTDPDIMRCPNCGHEWARDLSEELEPGHSCVPGLLKQLAALEERKAILNERLRAATAASFVHSRTNHGAPITH